MTYPLWQVVGIELLGYRKRLQYGIGELRRAHSEWAEQKGTSQVSNAKASTAPKIPAKKRAPRKATPTTTGPTHAQLLREDVSELSLRSPSEAQSVVVGRTNRTAKLPSETWRHSNSALTEGCNYQIKVTSIIIMSVTHTHTHTHTYEHGIHVCSLSLSPSNLVTPL